MPWVLLDIAIGVLALAVLGLTGFALYRRARGLTRVIGDASRVLGEHSAGLTVQQPPSRSAAK